MAVFNIEREEATDRGWRFSVSVIDTGGRSTSHRLDVSWADYNLWSADGGDAPAAVAEAVIGFVLDHVAADDSAPLPDRFDASMVRRWHRDADAEIPRRIRPRPM